MQMSRVGVMRQSLLAGRATCRGSCRQRSGNCASQHGVRAGASGTPWRRHARFLRNTAVVGAVSQTQYAENFGSRDTTAFELACPICTDTKFELKADRGMHDAQHCSRCARTFNTNRSSPFVDLTLTSGVTSRVYKESLWGGVEIFRNPLVSFVYERGWRQGFAWAGFPVGIEETLVGVELFGHGRTGVEREFEMAMDLLRPAFGKVLVDMSCGSGIFSRRFASSRRFGGVIAADYSESMLQQTQRTFDDDGFVNDGSVLLLRADVGRLPFPTGSVAAIHAGAAIHCWPNPTAAMAEISRVLAPGGVFVASTFLKAAAPLGQLLGDDIVRPLNQLDRSSSGAGAAYRWWEEGELRDLATTVGLVNFQCERRLRFIMFSASKPMTNEQASGQW